MKKTLILALAATGLTISGTAAAQDRPARPDPAAGMTRADAEARAAEAFARMDANGDGVINAEDREARQRERFARADADGDGAVTFEEQQAAREAHREMRDARRAERGGEAREGRGMRGDRRGRRGGMRGMMAQRADANNDGAISQSEFAAAALSRFDQADANGDGTVTAEERQAQRDAMRERMPRRRGNRAG